MNEVLVLINNIDSVWGTDVVKFLCKRNTYSIDVRNALEEAKVEIEEEGISEETWMPEISEEILNRAAEKLGATWSYCAHVSFKYTYDGKWLEEEKRE